MSADPWGFPNEATPQGSAYYYVARFCPPAQRDRVAAWLAWFDHIDRIAWQARDPGVARLKLDWWREEVKLAAAGTARHPLMQTLSPDLRADWQARQMRRAIDALEPDILRRSPPDRDAWWARAEDHWGSRMQLLAGGDAPQTRQCCASAGRWHACVTRLQHLGRDIQQDFLPLPGEDATTAGLTLEALQSGAPSPALATLAGALLETADEDWRAARDTARRLPGMGPVLALCAQSRRIARRLRRLDYQTQRQAPLATPLGLLWSAWRRR